MAVIIGGDDRFISHWLRYYYDTETLTFSHFGYYKRKENIYALENERIFIELYHLVIWSVCPSRARLEAGET